MESMASNTLVCTANKPMRNFIAYFARFWFSTEQCAKVLNKNWPTLFALSLNVDSSLFWLQKSYETRLKLTHYYNWFAQTLYINSPFYPKSKLERVRSVVKREKYCAHGFLCKFASKLTIYTTEICKIAKSKPYHNTYSICPVKKSSPSLTTDKRSAYLWMSTKSFNSV